MTLHICQRGILQIIHCQFPHSVSIKIVQRNKETIYTVQSYLQVVEHTHLPHPTDESHQSQILRYQCTNGQLLFQMTSNCQEMLQTKI